jgi:hypothetical protein
MPAPFGRHLGEGFAIRRPGSMGAFLGAPGSAPIKRAAAGRRVILEHYVAHDRHGVAGQEEPCTVPQAGGRLNKHKEGR